MMNLLIIRERICSFFQKWERLLIPIIRFLYMLVILLTFQQLFGYNDTLYQSTFVLGISFVCAFVPSGVIYLIAALIACVDVISLSYEAAALLLILFVIIYLLYLRLVPGKSWIVLVTVILLMKLPCCIPLLVAMLVGPIGIVPTVCGIVIYYYGVHAHALQPLLTASVEGTTVQPISYLVNNMMADKEMILFIVVFSVVIMITYLIYKSSIKHAWSIAIVSGMVIMILSLLAGSVMLEDELGINIILLGSIISGAVAFAVQFFKCVVDYSRIEIVQFEDDEFYYYVKAVPKINIAKKDVNVKKINARRQKQES